MPQITQQPKPLSKEQTTSAVTRCLEYLYNKKTEKEQKQLLKARENDDAQSIAELTQVLSEINEKFAPTTWLHDAVHRMAAQLNFGTHISKGIHPDAKGDNISFQPQHELPVYCVGTHSINSPYIDANGNAAALPLAAFFDYQVVEDIKIRDLIFTDHADFIATLSNDPVQAQQYHHVFKQALSNHINIPISHERNKQMLWVHNPYSANLVDDLHYTTIIPLYPSVLTYELFQRINHIRYSETNKTARDNRYKKTAEQQPYTSMFGLATVQLGGTKPQNVSQLMSKQGGRNYLLPSLPPIIDKFYGFKLSKFADSIFDSNSLIYHCRYALEEVYAVIQDAHNNVDVRNRRKLAIDSVLHTLFAIAQNYRTALPAGWSKDYQIDLHQKLWLDPQRAELAGEEDFAQLRVSTDWYKAVIYDFAQWFNILLKSQFKDKENDFGTAEKIEWQREIEDMSKRYERAGKGVFL